MPSDRDLLPYDFDKHSGLFKANLLPNKPPSVKTTPPGSPLKGHFFYITFLTSTSISETGIAYDTLSLLKFGLFCKGKICYTTEYPIISPFTILLNKNLTEIFPD
jgi:hypothetical protein